MDNNTKVEIVTTYFRAVCDAYRLGNVESSYNAPIMTLFTDIGCAARDLSGERKGQTGENIDIKLWHSEEEVTETEPFAGVEVKKIRFVKQTEGKTPWLVLVEGKKGSKSGVNVMPDLIMKNSDGSNTDEFRSMFGDYMDGHQ